jgi:GTP-binding protein EngB required for normal cell division
LSPTNNIDQQQLLDLKDAAPEKPFIIVVSGASNVGKSTLIKQAHHKLRLAETTTASKFNVPTTLTKLS